MSEIENLMQQGIEAARENGRLEVETAALHWIERWLTVIPAEARDELIVILRPTKSGRKEAGE